MPKQKNLTNISSAAPPKASEEIDDKPKNDKLALDIGRRIAEARNGLGLPQQAVHARTRLADKEGIGVSRAALSLYERGVNKPGAREITLLCEVLHVSPNWLLYGTESVANTVQPSTIFLRGSELDISARLAFAMLALDPSERDSLAQLVFSLLTKKLGDINFASLMTMASLLSQELMREIIESVGEENKDLPIADMLPLFTKEMSTAIYTNAGTSHPAIPEDCLDEFDPENPPPPRHLK